MHYEKAGIQVIKVLFWGTYIIFLCGILAPGRFSLSREWFQNPPAQAKPRTWWHLTNLGKVGDIAEVCLNGKAVNTLSMPPFRCDISGLLKKVETWRPVSKSK
jgi:hypothetical protein